MQAKKRDGLVTAANYQTGDGLILNVIEAPGKASSIDRISALALAAEATPSQGVVKVGAACSSRRIIVHDVM